MSLGDRLASNSFRGLSGHFNPLRLHLPKEGMKVDLKYIASSFPNQLLPFGFFMRDGPTSPFAGTVIRSECTIAY